MNLIQPTFLFAMAAVAVPIVLHLLFRRHTKVVKLGSIRFLDELMRETARRRKVQRWLLLAMRIACVALLAFLFMRPFVRAAHKSSGERLVVVLIDQSASMSRRRHGVRLIDEAVNRVSKRIGTVGENTIVEVAFFDAAVYPLALEKVGRKVTAPERLFGGTSYAAAIQWARDRCLHMPIAARDVHLLTDLQRSGLDWVAEEDLPEGVRLHVEDVGETQANNLAIVAVTSSPTVTRPKQDVTVRGTLFNYGQFEFTDVSVRLTLTSGGQQMHFEETLNVPPQQAAEFQFDVPGLSAGRWEGTVDINVQDDLAFDNRRHLVVLSQPQPRVVILDGQPRSSDGSGTYFLTRAVGLASPGSVAESSPFRAEVLSYNEGDRLPTLAGVSIVVLADCPVSAADAVRLQSFVEAGGGLIVFAGESTTAEACGPLGSVGLLPGTIGDVRRTSDLPFRLQWWDVEHPALAPFADPQEGDLRQFAFSAYQRVKPTADSRVLATFGDEEHPALLERPVGEGRVFWFCSSAGREWSTASRSRLYLPFVHQLLRDCIGLTGAGLVQSMTMDEWRDRLGMGDNVNAVSRENVTASANADAAPAERLRPGVMAESQRSIVVSVAESESNPERCAASDIRGSTLSEEGSTADDDDARNLGAATLGMAEAPLASRANEWWPWLTLLLTGLLLMETFVANRTTA